MARLAEEAGGRADEDERALAVAEVPEEAPRGEERGGQIRVDRRTPALERELPDGDALLRPDARDRRADVERPGLGEHPVDRILVRQVGLDDRRTACSQGPLTTRVVVHDNIRALGGEQPDARSADAARPARDQHARPCETALHPLERKFPILRKRDVESRGHEGRAGRVPARFGSR